MSTIQPESQKIKKRQKGNYNIDLPRNFICGGCSRTYASYAALYCHIKRKHDGITPSKTILQKPPPKIKSQHNPQIGRPQKARTDIDVLDENEQCLEIVQNDLVSFLGEKLLMMANLSPKVSLEDILTKILETSKIYTDKWLTDIQESSKIFITENKEDQILETLDFDAGFTLLDQSKGLNVIVWFMMWLGKLYVKPEFIPDLCLVFSRIWKVLDETQLEAPDLDNKLVWKKVQKDCEGLIRSLVTFKEDMTALSEFIQRICQLIGKAFEENAE